MNKQQLKSKMALYGDTLESLSKELGCTLATLSNKINEKTSFRQDEIKIISDRYRLTNEEIIEIFF